MREGRKWAKKHNIVYGWSRNDAVTGISRVYHFHVRKWATRQKIIALETLYFMTRLYSRTDILLMLYSLFRQVSTHFSFTLGGILYSSRVYQWGKYCHFSLVKTNSMCTWIGLFQAHSWSRNSITFETSIQARNTLTSLPVCKAPYCEPT